MGKFSREKGKRGERELAALLRHEGFEARRGQQYSGGGDSPDVICGDLPGLHFEVKRTESLQLWKALEQAKYDASENKIPVIAHRRNHSEWIFIIPQDAFFQLIRETNQPLMKSEE